MRVFLSYAHEQHQLAERLAASLREERYDVFYDRESLGGGEAYDGRIAREIARAALFLFLVSPASLAPGYARSELELARKRWRRLGAHVLPVEAVPLASMAELPGALRVLNVLRPQGDPVPEVLAEVRRFRGARWRRLALAVGLPLAALGGVSLLLARPHRSPRPSLVTCRLWAEVRLPRPLPEGLPATARLAVRTGRGEDYFPMNSLGPIPLDAPLSREESWTISVEDLPTASFREGRVRGCPANAQEIEGDEGATLVLRPR